MAGGQNEIGGRGTWDDNIGGEPVNGVNVADCTHAFDQKLATAVMFHVPTFLTMCIPAFAITGDLDAWGSKRCTIEVISTTN